MAEGVAAARAGGVSDALDPSSVLWKVMRVLHAFEVGEQDLTMAEIGRRTGLPKSTLFRTLNDMTSAKLVERENGRYRLGGHLFELGMRAVNERQLVDVATPFMQDLYERTRETVHLGTPDGGEVLYIAKIGGHRQALSASRVGGRLPLHCTAIGKALLAVMGEAEMAKYVSQPLERRTARTVTAPGILRAQLIQARASGAAYEYEESGRGIACVAAAVLYPAGRSAVGISVAGPITRFVPPRHAAAVRAAASGIRSALRDLDGFAAHVR